MSVAPLLRMRQKSVVIKHLANLLSLFLDLLFHKYIEGLPYQVENNFYIITIMHQTCYKQTRIDQFYKVISKKNNDCGEKISDGEFNKNLNANCEFGIPVMKSKKNVNNNHSIVNNQVQIINDRPFSPIVSECRSTQKRKVSSKLKNSIKKHKLNNMSNHIINNQMQLNRNLNDINASKKESYYSEKDATKKYNTSFWQSYLANRINNDNVYLAIKNLNYVKQGVIILNEFDLHLIYEKKEFKIKIFDDVASNFQKLEFKNIIFPQDEHANHLLMIVIDIFSNPINCGYFLKNELDIIFLLFTLSSESQMLFVRLLKRKLGWHRMSTIKYLEISNNLNPFFKELIQNQLCESDLSSTNILILLSMLQVEEVRNICQKLKIDHRQNKAVLISKLLKYGNVSKSFFVGAKSPKCVLRSMVLQILQSCVRLPENIINLFDKVLTLFHPIQDATESIADLFLILTNVQKGELLYPPIFKKNMFPVFKNMLHLTNFVKSKNALKVILMHIEKKEWDEVRNLGRLALKHLLEAKIIKERSLLPLHIKKFMPEYSWIKVLAKSIVGFKKTPKTIIEAVSILKFLINEKNFPLSNQGQWYNELALIEMHHRNDLESSAALTLHALQQNILTEVDIADLIERLKKLLRRKTGLSKETRVLIQKAQKKANNGLNSQFITIKKITANMANRIRLGGKSTWSVNINCNNKYYGSIEMLALQHYISKENFYDGLHCEGSLPVTLFTVYFWDELYNTFVPGAFVSSYQVAPLDLFTTEFVNNRKKCIEDKIKFIRKFDLESFTDWMEKKYSNCSKYRSLITNTLFKSNQQFKEVVACLGMDGVTGICEKLISNFKLWRTGFPDLIVWNAFILKCKIVEVKGPGDVLSEKQKLWLQYLERLGIKVEVCRVEALGISSK